MVSAEQNSNAIVSSFSFAIFEVYFCVLLFATATATATATKIYYYWRIKNTFCWQSCAPSQKIRYVSIAPFSTFMESFPSIDL